jgi:hypothetical protein
MHHAEKTKGLLTKIAIEEAAKRPFNLGSGRSSAYELHYGGRHCESIIGSNRHVWPAMEDGDFTVPLLIDDTPLVLFRAEDSHLLLSVQLFDQANNLLVRISDNELSYSVDPWDIELVGRRLIVRNGPRDIFVGMNFDLPSRITIDQGRVWRNGFQIKFANHQLVVPGESLLEDCEMRDCVVGVAIGEPPDGLGSIGFLVAGQTRMPYPKGPDPLVTRLFTYSV